MFIPRTEKIKDLGYKHPSRVKELERLFDGTTNVYIDFANVAGWQEQLGWHVQLRRLKQFLDSFDNIQSVKFYNGTLEGSRKSERLIGEARRYHYEVRTKPVKIRRVSIDVSSIPANSPTILEGFIRKSLLQKLSIETIEMLNKQLARLNGERILHVNDLKCNFDVEIGLDMLLDHERNSNLRTFVLWSGDSDFADPVKKLLHEGKKVVLFSTARRVASELSELRQEGLFIFDIRKVRDFICWTTEMSGQSRNRKGDSSGAPSP